MDTTPEIIDLAIKKNAHLLISHHPLIYRPLASLASGQPVAERVTKLIRANLALFVLHTNYDTVPGGIDDVLAGKLGVMGSTPITGHKQDKIYKLVVFVPEDNVEDVRNAMADAGAGLIGQYTHCSFRSAGTGSFVPLPTAHPYIGAAGKLEEVEEYRLEMVCVGSFLDNVIEAMIERHPYDQVAYDVYELANPPMIYGYGRIGTLAEAVPFADFAETVKSVLNVKWPKVYGEPTKLVRKIALCGGSGSSLFREAADAGAEVYVTGDTKHHDILDAAVLGMAVIDAGHFETEKPGMVALVERLRKTFDGSGMEIEYIE